MSVSIRILFFFFPALLPLLPPLPLLLLDASGGRNGLSGIRVRCRYLQYLLHIAKAGASSIPTGWRLKSALINPTRSRDDLESSALGSGAAAPARGRWEGLGGCRLSTGGRLEASGVAAREAIELGRREW